MIAGERENNSPRIIGGHCQRGTVAAPPHDRVAVSLRCPFKAIPDRGFWEDLSTGSAPKET